MSQPGQEDKNEAVCRNIGQNISSLSRERRDLRIRADRARARRDAARSELDNARKQLADARKRARVSKQDRDQRRLRRLEQIQQVAEIAEKIAEALLGDYTANVRQKEANVRLQEQLHEEAERRWREVDRRLLQQEQLFEHMECGSALNHREF